MLKYCIGALIVFAVSSTWLFFAISYGNATKSWTPTPAQVGTTETSRNLGGRRAGIHAHVTYVVNGITYEGLVDNFLVSGTGTIYVNPNDPTQIVGIRGANIQHFGRPMIATIGSGLFLVVLGLIAFSPKED